ncbi:rho-GTPase-activating protein 1 [Plasmodium vivax Mauritania I]|uniref:Rho-GTPase-activating protein 1 n=1 Tax=Plasmodium vivax Mauritania I TaxID=1035515 RepID=A0A0J9TDY5_PLAVI|nr:rho-GTPase-activating protein 1 [Plasmodium vivax Mauritania I]
MLDSDAEVPQEILVEYEKLLKKSYTENFDELYKTDLLKVIGKDGYGSHIVLLIPCFIVSSGADPEKTLRYAILTLDPIVKENYVLILCETHTSWLTDAVYAYAKQWYDTLPRKYKKNLKKLYLVHSGFMSKTMLTIVTPFVSAKFWKKVEYIEKLEDLFLKLNINPTYYLRCFPYIVQRNEEVLLGGKTVSVFGADLEILCQRFGTPYMEYKHVPSILVDFLTHLLKPEIVNTKDLFYLQADANTLYGIIGDIEYGEPTTDFNNIPSLVCSFKLFLDTQKNGLLGKDAFTKLYHLKTVSASDKAIRSVLFKLYDKLEPGVKECLVCLLKFFKTVSTYSSENNMTVETLAKIFAPTFFRPRVPNAVFSQCIPLANRCLQMIIEAPDILTNPQKYDAESDSSDESESDDSKEKDSKSESSSEDTSSESHGSKGNKGQSSDSAELAKRGSKASERGAPNKKDTPQKDESKKKSDEESEEESEEESGEDSEEESEEESEEKSEEVTEEATEEESGSVEGTRKVNFKREEGKAE